MGNNSNSIVYIEDDLEMINLVKLIVENQGFTITGATSGSEGIELIKTLSPDIILLDLMMPDVDGYEIYKKLKSDEALKNIPVIIITAKAQAIDRVLGIHIAKVDDYISKPFRPHELLSSIKKVIDIKSSYAKS
ncbi:MAG: response regulator [Bacteroidales bacterium]|nr:response regulator [Bacteroidales bacterium]